jgi:anti-anti-sigma factor
MWFGALPAGQSSDPAPVTRASTVQQSGRDKTVFTRTRRGDPMRSSASKPLIPPAGRYTVVQTPEEVDAANADEIRQLLLHALNASENGPLIVDLTGTTFCDSSGLRALVRASIRATALRRGMYAVAPPSGLVRRIFEIAALPRLIPTHDDLASAIAMADSANTYRAHAAPPTAPNGPI